MTLSFKRKSVRAFHGLAGSPLAALHSDGEEQQPDTSAVENKPTPASAPRRFQGLAGSPLATVNVNAMPQQPEHLPPVLDTREMLGLVEMERREKEAARSRANRKKKRDQLIRIKAALRTPPEEVLEKEKQEFEKEFVHHADTGTGKRLITCGLKRIEKIVAHLHESAASLGSPTSEGSHTFFPELDRRPVKPQGSGGDRESDHDSDREPSGRFQVKLNDRDEDALLRQVVEAYCLQTPAKTVSVACVQCGANQGGSAVDFTCLKCGERNGGERFDYQCRLCYHRTETLRDAMTHMGSAHGDEHEPSHDDRFGNVIYRWVRGGKKPPNLEKAKRKARTAQLIENKEKSTFLA